MQINSFCVNTNLRQYLGQTILILSPYKQCEKEERIMSDATKDCEEAALEIMFADARKYPLLTAQQEQSIDSDKWLALANLNQLMMADPQCRSYLRQWAENTDT